MLGVVVVLLIIVVVVTVLLLVRILITLILILIVPVGFWSGGDDKSREIELGRFRGGCSGTLDCVGGMLPTPSGCAGVWEGPEIVKAGPTIEPISLMHGTTCVKCNSHECILADMRF